MTQRAIIHASRIAALVLPACFALGCAGYATVDGYAAEYVDPPPPAVANLASAAFAPATLTNGATYYWQVTARNAGGTTAGPVWSFTAIVAPPTAPG